jgi:hypothetical protein
VSLVNGIPTLSRFTIGLRESFHLQDESHYQKRSECRLFTSCLGGVCSTNQYAFSTYDTSMNGFADTSWPVESSSLTGSVVGKAIVGLEQWR